ncbi:hemolysin XhlA family protein [Geobacillus sp. BMUD]|uniref:hemolysin XhlA family protein n=1 Tax=Geobacillus sp. BMUD TaxID=2508876 RepID=UPI0034CD8DEC
MEHRIEKLESDVIELKTRIAVHDSKIDKIENKIEKIESNTSWTVRLILGAVILAALNLLLKGGV